MISVSSGVTGAVQVPGGRVRGFAAIGAGIVEGMVRLLCGTDSECFVSRRGGNGVRWTRLGGNADVGQDTQVGMN